MPAAAIDGVILGQPGIQMSLTLAALAAGKHAHVDKPLGRNAADARAVAQMARAANRIV
ncbi:hypothetical protein E3T61_05650 [Cryobacterium lactosi]|uniref:Gfo/Idh/MocA-like oxidoreductase N-terminal domain-containing protein n=1 Tax=Cryobacterium lactosi TaxID=1259202 RepID=A0A4R9BXS2_9MICO|nr:Gfo/Idh/MocA family oxidoreductase [Cryobacterium lactosi]TFD93053.1 hypothetical protein E3T61_05650 [Cryobacterium lactosi]